MYLERVVDFLKTVPNASMSTDSKELYCACPWCDFNLSSPNAHHLAIRIDVEEGETMVYHCFRASCQESGILKTSTLQRLGCTDMETILELAKHNAAISKTIDRFTPKKKRKLITLNINNRSNKMKAAYINVRLGTHMTVPELKDLKIQLSLYDYLTINHIKRLAYPKQVCDMLDDHAIGFISIYEDYVVFRDITPDLITGRRYTMYRSTGVPDPGDTKLYCIPGEVDLTDPEPAVLNIAEGPFSILGVYLNTELGRDRRNCLFLANCGGGYLRTIKQICRQYGFLDVDINIYSDSEINMGVYQKLYKQLKNEISIHSMIVYYNEKAEDFGVPVEKIKIKAATVK